MENPTAARPRCARSWPKRCRVDLHRYPEPLGGACASSRRRMNLPSGMELLAGKRFRRPESVITRRGAPGNDDDVPAPIFVMYGVNAACAA